MSSKEAINRTASDTVLNGAFSALERFPKRKRADSIETAAGPSNNPTILVNNIDVPLESESNLTIIPMTENRATNSNTRETEQMVFKLDKLHDKKARFDSHVDYLTKCLTNNLIPNGLKVYVEPSIGNRDETFLKKWHDRLDEFSRILTNDVVEFSEQELVKTNTEITATTAKLQEHISEAQFGKLNETIAMNLSIRERELKARKNRKFYGLKYKNDQTSRDNQHAQNRPFWQERDRRSWDDPNNQNNRNVTSRDKHDDQGDRNRKSLDDNRNANNNPARRYVDVARGDQSRGYRDRPVSRQHSRERLSRLNSSHRNPHQSFNTDPFRDQANSSNTDDIFDKISVERKRSQRDVSTRNSIQNNIANPSEKNARDEEIKQLQDRLRHLETNDVNTNEEQKNVQVAQRTDTGTNNELEEMKHTLLKVLETIKEFDKRLTTLSSTGPIHLERS